MDWKSSAKRQELQVRTFEPSSTFTVMLCMAVETSERLWQGYSPAHLERVIVATASVASYVTERQHTVGAVLQRHAGPGAPGGRPSDRGPRSL